jgi:hypothetical protein
LHPQWPVQTFKMGQKLEFVLYELTYYGQKKKSRNNIQDSSFLVK